MANETTKRPSVLSRSNYAKMLFWLENRECPVPAFAESFMTTLNYLYIDRQGTIPMKRRPVRNDTPASRLSLESLIEDTPKKENDNRTQETAMDEIEKEAQKTVPVPETPAHIGDDTLPYKNEDGFREAGYDSAELAKAIAWHYDRINPNERNGRPISMNFLQTVLYTIYGTVLAERGIRLTTEHPQMWQYGPMFARVYSKMKHGIIAEEKAAIALREKDPSLDEFINRIIRINARKRNKELSELHTSKTSPWGRCLKANGEKWSSQISDTDIADWFRRYIDKSKN